MAAPLDILTRPTKFVKSGIYAIIVAEGESASPNAGKGVTLVATHSDPSITGNTGRPITATLLETPRSAGEDFATLDAVGSDLQEYAAEDVYCIVVPKSEEAKANFFEMYVLPRSGPPVEGMPDNPTAPYFWYLISMAITDPVTIRFKIRYEPHLVGGPEGQGTEPMVQMYPMSGTGLIQKGWNVHSYRTDPKGTGPMFQSPPEWKPDVIVYVPGVEDTLLEHGLLFGKDPPLIAADVPFVE
jgi:hypothetical protein